MTWLRVDANLSHSRLIDVLRTSCGLSRVAAIGSVVSLWSQCVIADNGGYIGRLSDTWIEDACGWTGQPGQLAAVIREHHLTDGRIKDWDDYQGALEQRREADRLRKQRERERKKTGQPPDSPGDVTRKSGGTSRGHPNATGTVTDTELQQPLSHPRAPEDDEPGDDERGRAVAQLTEWIPAAAESFRLIIAEVEHTEAFVGFVRSLREGIGGPVYADDAITRGLIHLCANGDHVGGISSRQVTRYVQDAATAIAEESEGVHVGRPATNGRVRGGVAQRSFNNVRNALDGL
jgi:hypothetical protein